MFLMLSLSETLSRGSHHVDVVLVVVSAVVVAQGPWLDLSIAVFQVVISLEPIESPCGVFAPGIEPF